MLTSLATTRRLLGLAAGALLAASALAVPAGASAGVTVHPATTPEGDAGATTAVTTIDLRCGDPDPLPPRSACRYDVRVEADPLGTNFIAPAPQKFFGDPDTAFTVPVNVDVLGDTQIDGDQTYTVVVQESVISETGDILGETGGTFTAGTIVDDDAPQPQQPPPGPGRRPASGGGRRHGHGGGHGHRPRNDV